MLQFELSEQSHVRFPFVFIFRGETFVVANRLAAAVAGEPPFSMEVTHATRAMGNQ